MRLGKTSRCKQLQSTGRSRRQWALNGALAHSAIQTKNINIVNGRLLLTAIVTVFRKDVFIFTYAKSVVNVVDSASPSVHIICQKSAEQMWNKNTFRPILCSLNHQSPNVQICDLSSDQIVDSNIKGKANLWQSSFAPFLACFPTIITYLLKNI